MTPFLRGSEIFFIPELKTLGTTQHPQLCPSSTCTLNNKQWQVNPHGDHVEQAVTVVRLCKNWQLIPYIPALGS
jgi:hypothetical protein